MKYQVCFRVKTWYQATCEKITVAEIHDTSHLRSKKNVKSEMFAFQIGVYIMQCKTLHDRLEIRNFLLLVIRMI